jgi:glycosyltransferase involved in cell wall biosynthesis
LAKTDKTTVLASNSKDTYGSLGLPGNHYIAKKNETIEGVNVRRFPVLPLFSYGLKKAEKGIRHIFPGYFRYAPLDQMRIYGWGPFTPAMYPHILSSEYDCVHATLWPTTSLFLSFHACKQSKIPFAITPFFHYLLRDFTQSPVLRGMLPLCTTIVAVTESERRALIKIGAPEKRTFVIPLSLDAANVPAGSYDRFRKKYGLEDKFVVLAHPWPGKGGIDVLLAMKQLSSRFSNLALVTFGKPEKEFLSALSSIAPLNFSVINLGWVYGQAKDDAYAGSDVLAMPSTNDAFGMTYLEAWSIGKPVIGGKNTSAEDIIQNGSDGFLVQINNISDLGARLSALAQNPELAARMGQAGKDRVEKEFNPERMSSLFGEAVAESLKHGLPY